LDQQRPDALGVPPIRFSAWRTLNLRSVRLCRSWGPHGFTVEILTPRDGDAGDRECCWAAYQGDLDPITDIGRQVLTGYGE
jgi:hypothetical protein